LLAAQPYVGKFIGTFKDYPPRQSAAAFNLDDVMKTMQEGGGSR
jgi:arylsulfatase